MSEYFGVYQLCPGCFSPYHAGIEHSCGIYQAPDPKPQLTDADVDRIARRVVALMRGKSNKRMTEQ